MEPENSLPCSQEPATGLYCGPGHILTSYLFNMRINIIIPSTFMSPKWFLPVKCSH